MGEFTAISWSDATFNPWIGCTRVSPACQHCYAETADKRRLINGETHWGKDAPRHVTSDVYWRQPLKWNRAAAAQGRNMLVFCASQADVFEDRPDLLEPRRRLWELIEATPNLTWQLLTKRPENILSMVPLRWLLLDMAWPSNVWVGTTVEDQERADLRIPQLVDVPASVRFLSCEPLLGPVDLSRWLHLEWMDSLRLPEEPRSFRTEDGDGGWGREMFAYLADQQPAVQWVIVGGESGAHHRSLDLGHARDVVEQCAAADVPCWFKQVGGQRPTSGGDLLDGREIHQFPYAHIQEASQ